MNRLYSINIIHSNPIQSNALNKDTMGSSEYTTIFNMSSFILAGIIAILYGIARFLEMRFILKETKPLKGIIRDTIIVYLTVIGGVFIFEQIQENVPQISASPEVHVGDANF